MGTQFFKLKENFTCDVRETKNIGNGYTNHCSYCFFSKHVDIYPGDRASTCLGLMEPISYETHSKKGVVITHQCRKCYVLKKNKLAQKSIKNNKIRLQLT